MKKKFVRESLTDKDKLNESPWFHFPDGHKEFYSDDEIKKNLDSGKWKKLSLKEAFPGPIKKPYDGVVIKINDGYYGVVFNVFERNGDYLFDFFMWDPEYKPKWEVMKNLSWERDYKTAYGDKHYGWSAFGENGKPNKRHEEEIMPLIRKFEDTFGITAKVAKDEELNQ